MNKLVFEDSIILYWDKEWELPDGIEYFIELNANLVGKTIKTHYSIENLQSDKEYKIAVYRTDENGNKTFLFNQEICTLNAKNKLDVTKPPYNAVGDGVTLNTKAIQQAVNDCTENDCVYIPEGTYLTGALTLHSDMELYIEQSATLQGSVEVEDYAPKVKTRFEGQEMECYRSLINMGNIDRNGGYNCQNVIVRGKGKIIGGGRPLALNILEVEKARLKEFMEANKEFVATCENVNTLPGRARGRLINMCNCNNVVLCGLEMGMGASWNIHFVYSKNIVTCGCKIFSHDGDEHVWNGDGWDPDSSEDCTVFDTLFDTFDDGIAIKSGKNPEGNIINKPTKNIKIFDCRGGHAVAIGSELSGGVENVYVWDCDYPDSFYGLSVKTAFPRGGYVKNVVIRNCKLTGIGVRTKYGTNLDGQGAGTLTDIENIHIENIFIYGEKHDRVIYPEDYKIPIYLDGFDGDGNEIKNVTIKNVRIEKRPDGGTQDIHVKNVKGLTIENVKYE